MLTNVCKPDKHGLCMVRGCTVTSSCVMYRDGLLPARYPVPATQKNSVTDLGERWSNWMD